MSMDEDTVRCDVCGYPVPDYEPGVSSVYVDEMVLHPECVKAAGIIVDEEEAPKEVATLLTA